jgi:hypothetical protein
MARSGSEPLSQGKSISSPYFQSDANLSGVIFHEVNAGLLKSFLYFEDRGKISFHDPLVLFDALQRCQADPRPAGELALAPA